VYNDVTCHSNLLQPNQEKNYARVQLAPAQPCWAGGARHFECQDRLLEPLATPALYEEAIKRNEGIISHLGPLVVRTGQFTGRSPNDKFVVKEPTSDEFIWWGKVNRPFKPDRFDELHRRMTSYLQGKDVFVQDCWAGADPQYRMPVRIVSQYAWHSLFVRNMFIQATPEELAVHKPEFVVIDCPGFHASPEV
jgi:phosphoenolpyruvate carboxykinase (ATP)